MTLRMTPQAFTAVQWAREEATRQGSATRTEHLVQGLFETLTSSYELFVDLHVNLPHLREQLEEYLDQMPPALQVGRAGDAPDLTRALEFGENEASITRSEVFDTDHMLIGLAMEPNGRGGHFLMRVCGLDYVTLRRSVYKLRKEHVAA